MSNEHGQQQHPGQQSPMPGFAPPPQSGYPQTPPGGQPAYPAHQPYPGGPGSYGYGQQPAAKPGSVTGAAVLGFIQAGITLITTGILFSALFGTASVQDSSAAFGWILALAQLAGLVLLIFGAVRLLSGSSRTLYIVGAALELVICAYYLISFLAIPNGGMFAEQVADLKAAMAVIPIVFAIMPLIGLILALGSAAGNYVSATRGR
ncbi:hypothetical protein [Kibdelosporangium phytohabitans]|uniref:Uncharacterized protein n=1 Tax=Kibdelosporangium phytohabitans TaxID=860235 RepID=A0A0N9I234_9PSEU|nr:hypothetical protein [Kibdelosporangium phytohabitans]ALG12641.1 hypothetical protein AOZ06_42475 [Kibdelosporangium phytohabitans]MBE1464288.1 hypothetical protein [Kibdelosporangium phytohabitans]